MLDQRQWAAEQIALTAVGPELEEHRGLGLGLDAFTQESGPDLSGEMADTRDHRLPRGIAAHALDDRAVQLDDIRADLEDVPQACVPGAGVVDRQANRAAKVTERATKLGIVRDRAVLRDLEHDVRRRVDEDAPQLRSFEHERGRNVQGEASKPAESCSLLDRLLGGRRFERDPHANRLCLGELEIRRDAAVKPRQGFVAQHASRSQAHDRLEDRVERLAGDDRRDVSLELVLHPLGPKVAADESARDLGKFDDRRQQLER